jgi:CHAT domain-containing protein
VVEFYKSLQDEKLSKAQALQRAQKKLLAERVFQHLIHWAPFLMIGNWL